MKIKGAILAGGRGMRMGEIDKPLIELEGMPLIGHVISRFSPQVNSLVINANGDPARFRAFPHQVVADRAGPGAGPLAGLASVMNDSTTYGVTHIVTVPADTPFIPQDLVIRLAEALTGAAQVAIASSAGRLHPVIGLWPVTISTILDAHLISGRKQSMQAFLEQLEVREVTFPIREGIDPFFNVNKPVDLKKAAELLRA